MAIVYNNTDGAIGLADGGTPRTLTIKAGENISGGYWVVGSTLKGVVGSNASTFVSEDIIGYTVKTQCGSNPIGLAIADIASGTIGTIAQRGLYLLPSLSGTMVGSIDAGAKIRAGSGGTVLGIGSNTGHGTVEVKGDTSCGRAMTAGGILGEFVVVSLNI